MRQAISVKDTNAKRAQARQPVNKMTLQDMEAEKRLLMKDDAERERLELLDAEHRYLDRDGEVLKYEIRFPKTETKKNAVVGSVNHHKYAIPRGVKAVVPWFIVQAIKDTIETRHEPATDGFTVGADTTRSDSAQSEMLDHCQAINPGDSVPF